MTPPRPTEEIPDRDELFLRVHRQNVDKSGEVRPGAFANRPEGAVGLSVNSSKYASAEDTREGGNQPPEHYAVAGFSAGAARACSGQSVEHRPVEGNRAHSEVMGEKTTAARLQLLQASTVVITLDAGTTS